jgi:hypothetical protein
VVGGIAVFDVNDPQTPGFVDYVDPRVFSVDPETVIEDEGGEASDAGDLAPEGSTFISTADCQSGDPLLIVGYEVSGTTAVYRVDRAQARPGGPTPAEPTHVRAFGPRAGVRFARSTRVDGPEDVPDVVTRRARCE